MFVGAYSPSSPISRYATEEKEFLRARLLLFYGGCGATDEKKADRTGRRFNAHQGAGFEKPKTSIDFERIVIFSKKKLVLCLFSLVGKRANLWPPLAKRR